MPRILSLFAATLLASMLAPVRAQTLTLSEVQATGAKPLTAAEAKDLVSGAKTEFVLANGTLRSWTNGTNGTFVASRSGGDPHRRSGRGTWSIDADAGYCLTFDWGTAETERWCRVLYRVEDRYYAFGPDATPETRSGTYRFSR